jgi:hypothetical protein
MKKVFTLILELVFSFVSFSQSCLPDGIDFTTQAQIDSFQVNYPNCTEIEGDVVIEGNDMTNLNGLGVLTSIGGSFSVAFNPALTSLTGLNNLTSIGGSLTLITNEALTSLAGLDHLASIGGDVNIGYRDLYGNHGNPSLVNLSGLNNLNLIGGDLYIHCNDALNSLTGLNNLTSIMGSLMIEDSPSLADLTGLGNLTTVGGNLQISRNHALTSLTGLNLLASIGGDVSIGYTDTHGDYGNPSLVNLSGLNNLNYTGGNLSIQHNETLNSLTGLNNLTAIGGSLTIDDGPSLADLTGLGNLTTVGGDLQISRNNVLTSLTGLEGLTFIGGDINIGYSYLSGTYGNPDLTSLTGLQNVASIGGNLSIIGNYSLTSLIGLNKDNLKSIADIYIYDNYSLSTCAVKSLCDYLIQPDSNSTISIHDNSSGCDSLQEVKTACESFSLDDLTNYDELSIYPNPSSTQINIEAANTTCKFQFSIFNLNWQKLIQGQITEPRTVIDIGMLPGGMYFVRITTERSVMVGKFVKK